MTANSILLQKKYSCIIECFAKWQGVSLDAALDSFYHSEVYQLMRDVVSVLQVIEKNPFATQVYYAEQIGVSKRTISRMFVSLQEKGILIQNGTKKKTNWIIKK